MSTFVLVIALLLGYAYWRHIVAALAAGSIVLIVFGIAYVVQIATTGSAGTAG